VSDLTRKQGLGAIDVKALQAAADTYRKLGLVQKPIDAAQVVSHDLLPGL
jgi:NitT/TauT family transport system substrate-binding protein